MSNIHANLFTVLPFSLFIAASAHADNTDGLEISVRPGFGSAGSHSPVVYAPSSGARLATPPDAIYGDTTAPYGIGFNGQVSLGYRPSRFVSFGLSGGMHNSSASSVTGVSNLSRSALSAGPYLRVYIPLPFHIEPYIGIGAEYMHDVQTYSEPTQGILADYRLVHYGIAIPATVGVAYRFLNYFAVGPSFQYAQVFGADACAGVSASGAVGSNFCSGDSNPITAAKSYGVWSLGLDVRVTLF